MGAKRARATKRGRCEGKCKIYKDRNTRRKNKLRKMKTHINTFPHDVQAKKQREELCQTNLNGLKRD